MRHSIWLLVLVAAAASVRGAELEVKVLEGHEGTVRPAFSPDGKTIATGSDDQTIRLWDAATGALRKTLTGSKSGVWRVGYSPDGAVLASIDDQKLILWNALTGEQNRVLSGHTDSIRAVAFSPDGRMVVTGGNDETMRFWDLAMGELIRTLAIERKGELAEIVWSVAFAPDGKTMAVGSGNGVGGDGHVRIVDPATGTILQTFPGTDNHQIWSVAFSPDGKTLASGSWGGIITLRERETWKVVREWRAEGRLRGLTFSPDGKTIAAAIDRDIVLWHAATGEQRQVLSGHGNWIMQIAYSPDGKWLVSGGSDHTARLWKLD